MTLITIDIKNVASETHPDDKVVFRSPVVREAPGGGITSTAETVVPLVEGVGEKELRPGPVIVTFQCRGMADTRPKRGTVPNAGPVTVADVIGQNFTYTPPVVNEALVAIKGARDDAIGQVGEAVGVAIAGHLHTKADKSVVDDLVLRVPAGGMPGQLLKITPSGGVWSWADRHTPEYHDAY